MNSTIAAVVRVQLLCQLIAPKALRNSTEKFLIDTTVDQLTSLEKWTYLPEGYVAYPDIGMAYKIHDKITSWPAARKLCIAEGGQLAFIDTPEKVELVVNQYYKKETRHFYWLQVGVHKFERTWVSSYDGSRVSSSTQWDTNEPNDKWDCTAISVNKHTKKPGALRSRPCYNRDNNGYVCEIPIPKSDQTQS